MTMPAWVRAYLPPALRHMGNQWLGRALHFRGPYADWATASTATRGYADGALLDRVEAATAAVLGRQDVYEQDGTIKPGPPPPSHALAALLATAAADGGRLCVLDHGGALASHYIRWQPWLRCLAEVHWCVVEQPAYIDAGRRLFSRARNVEFLDRIESATQRHPNAVLASGVLQYLEEPMAALEALAGVGARTMVIDRTPFARDGRPRVLTQHVPERFGGGSYPLWILSATHVARCMAASGYRQLAVFDGDDAPIRVPGARATFAGSAWTSCR